ncbi:MAG: elongation factor P maturation arginine rhamnosyltransferase EarP, partial [Telluria sp.]
MPTSTTLAIFCKVVDNFGDIGICWRFCKQLVAEHGVEPTLWVDDLRSFNKICPQVDVAAAFQTIEGVQVRHWAGQDGVFAPGDVADIVVEFFAVD